MSLLRKLPLALGIAPLFVVAACAISAERTGDSGSAVSGTLAEAKACAIRDAYTDTPLGGFTSLTHDQLPGAIQALVPAHVEAIARFAAAPLGNVYLVQDFDDSTTFYDAAASVLARRDAVGAWSVASGAGLACSDVPPPIDASPAVDATPPPRLDGGASSFCDGTDALEVEPNDVTPEPLFANEWTCGSVVGSDVDTFSFEVPADAPKWLLGLGTDPDLSTNPPFQVLVDGVPETERGLIHADRGKHMIQVSSGTGTPIAYRLVVSVPR